VYIGYGWAIPDLPLDSRAAQLSASNMPSTA
jgi:hypothetical protein